MHLQKMTRKSCELSKLQMSIKFLIQLFTTSDILLPGEDTRCNRFYDRVR